MDVRTGETHSYGAFIPRLPVCTLRRWRRGGLAPVPEELWRLEEVPKSLEVNIGGSNL